MRFTNAVSCGFILTLALGCKGQSDSTPVTPPAAPPAPPQSNRELAVGFSRPPRPREVQIKLMCNPGGGEAEFRLRPWKVESQSNAENFEWTLEAPGNGNGVASVRLA